MLATPGGLYYCGGDHLKDLGCGVQVVAIAPSAFAPDTSKTCIRLPTARGGRPATDRGPPHSRSRIDVRASSIRGSAQ